MYGFQRESGSPRYADTQRSAYKSTMRINSGLRVERVQLFQLSKPFGLVYAIAKLALVTLFHLGEDVVVVVVTTQWLR